MNLKIILALYVGLVVCSFVDAGKKTPAPRTLKTTVGATVMSKSVSVPMAAPPKISPLVTFAPELLEITTKSQMKILIEQGESLHKSLSDLESSMEGEIPNLNDKALSSVTTPAKVATHKTPKKSINLNLLDDAFSSLKSVNTALDDSKKMFIQPNDPPVNKKSNMETKPALHIELLDDKFLSQLHDPPAKFSSIAPPSLIVDHVKNDINDHRAPNAAEGSSSSAIDNGDHYNQSKIIGASVGGSVASVVLVCGVVGTILIFKRRKRSTKDDKEEMKNDHCDDIQDYTSNEDTE